MLYEVVAQTREVCGHKHPGTLRCLWKLALLLKAQGRLEEAEAALTEAVAGAKEVLGADHPHTREYEEDLATLRKARTA